MFTEKIPVWEFVNVVRITGQSKIASQKSVKINISQVVISIQKSKMFLTSWRHGRWANLEAKARQHKYSHWCLECCASSINRLLGPNVLEVVPLHRVVAIATGHSPLFFTYTQTKPVGV